MIERKVLLLKVKAICTDCKEPHPIEGVVVCNPSNPCNTIYDEGKNILIEEVAGKVPILGMTHHRDFAATEGGSSPHSQFNVSDINTNKVLGVLRVSSTSPVIQELFVTDQYLFFEILRMSRCAVSRRA